MSAVLERPQEKQVTAEHITALTKAKIAIMRHEDSAFLTHLCFSLVQIWDWTIQTGATDGRHLYLNPKYFLELDLEERIFLLLHETLHVAYMHMGRLQGRNMKRWNFAADYRINYDLVARGFKMPEGLLYDAQYADMTTEEIYDALPENPQGEGMGDIIPDNSPRDPNKPDEPTELEKHIQDILVSADIQSKMAGNTPGSIPKDIQLFLQKLLKPKLAWHKILARHMSQYDKSDYSFARPNRRFFPDHYLPGMRSEALVDLTVALDTSGSVSEHDFTVFVTEMTALLRNLQPQKLTLLQFDTVLKEVHELASVQDLAQVKFTGRGGTNITPVMEWAEENKPQLLLVFSDGHFRMPQTQPKTDLIWLIHNNERFKPPFGKTIHYEIKR